MKSIKKIVLCNFRRFEGEFEIHFDDKLNILIGGNEAGKSSILLALDLVMSGSRSKVENIGIETLFNANCINNFLNGPKKVEDLPVLTVEIYLHNFTVPSVNGRNNTKKVVCDGLKLVCEPLRDYSKDISTILKDSHPNFPFEYYGIKFSTFAEEPYSGYKKHLKHLLLDSTQINNDYATREYTRSMYAAQTTPAERHKHGNDYRKTKELFRDDSLKDLNDRLTEYKFAIRSSPKSNLETDILITEDNIPIDSKGKGRQSFIKTEFALQDREDTLDVLLLEEPENHLSLIHMRKLVERISKSENRQLFLATHSSLICSRLNLQKAIILNNAARNSVSLKLLPIDTAKFFMKAPDNNILELALCRKAILVEGDAEFILMEAFYRKCANNSSLDQDGVHVISVDGTSFKRYLDLAKLLNIRTAVLRDNDGDYQVNCVDNYRDYASPHIEIFYEANDARSTFEICMYEDNKNACDALFADKRRTLTVQDYMLKNKTDAAYYLLEQKAASIVAPTYIQKAIEWIRQ